MSILRVDTLQSLDNTVTVDVVDLVERGSITSSDISLPEGGDLADALTYVTPEQFGAIGDGTLHPLSERYGTLAAAQSVYPFVTSLTQSIDWAALQKANNASMGVTAVQCPLKVYHLGNNYLQLSIGSKWYGAHSPQTDLKSTTFIREGNVATFGQDCVVRVQDATAAGSPDEFVRGIVFKGFKLTRNLPRRTASKGLKTIGLHANHGMKMEIDVTINGCEYGLFGYVCWGMVGTVRIDSCHKGIWMDADTATPEYTPVSGSAITCVDLRVEIDATPFGLVLRHCKYSKFTGFIEGILATSTYSNYDYTNETAIAVSAYVADSVDITQLGIEAWQGVHVYANRSSVSVNESWTQDYFLVNTSGKSGPYAAIASLMGATELYTLPETNNSYFYALNGAVLTLRNMTGDMSSDGFANTFLITTDTTSRFCMENCSIYFGSSRLIHPLNGCWKNITFTNDRFFKDYMVPSGYTWIGNGRCQTTSWTLGSIGASGQFTFSTPTGWAFRDVNAYTLGSTAANQSSAGIVGFAAAPGDGGVTLQTSYTGTAGTYSLYYKATLEITK